MSWDSSCLWAQVGVSTLAFQFPSRPRIPILSCRANKNQRPCEQDAAVWTLMVLSVL
jgi:hypothetical protein